MKKKQQIVSAQLRPIPQIIWEKLNTIKSHGWFSQFVNESLIKEYGSNFEEKVLKEILIEKQSQRDQLEKEMDKIVKKLEKVKK